MSFDKQNNQILFFLQACQDGEHWFPLIETGNAQEDYVVEQLVAYRQNRPTIEFRVRRYLADM